MEFLRIGKIVDTHGMNGEVKILPMTDNPELFYELDFLMLSEKGKVVRSIEIDSIREQNELLLCKSGAINSISEAEGIKGLEIVIPENILPAPESNEVYFKDIKGSKVMTEDGKLIGTLVDYIESGSADVFRVESENGEYFLISNNPVHVLKIDEKNKEIIIEKKGLVSEDI
jgi:16S rRNA processing protein RimM